MGKIDPETKAEWAEGRRRLQAIADRLEREIEEKRQGAERRRLRLQRMSFGVLGRGIPQCETRPGSGDARLRMQAIVDRLERQQDEARRSADKRRQRLQHLSFGLLGRQGRTENGQIA